MKIFVRYITIIAVFFGLMPTIALPQILNNTALQYENSDLLYKKSKDGNFNCISDVIHNKKRAITFYSQDSKNQKTKTHKKQLRFTFLGFGTINFGNVTYYPYKPIPEGQDPSLYTNAGGPNPAEPYDFSYSFGISIDYRILDFLALFLDGGFNTWKLRLADKDGYSYGQWVYETTGYTSAVVGPFTMDTYYYFDCTSLRIGARYLFGEKFIQPWAGAGIGIYAWQATIGNRKEALKIGNPDSGLSFGYSILGGIDISINDFVFRVFLDYGSAIGYPRITGLLKDYPDAAFENTGGEHVTGPYKIGAAIGVKY